MALTLAQLGAFNRNMSPKQMVAAWNRLPQSVKDKVPYIGEAIAAIAVALALREAANKLYATAVKAEKTTEKVITTASGTLTGNPVAAQQAATDSAKTSNQAANSAVTQAVAQVKSDIVNRPIPGT